MGVWRCKILWSACGEQNHCNQYKYALAKYVHEGVKVFLVQAIAILVFTTETWEVSQPETFGTSPVSRHSHTCTVVERKLYIFGGQTISQVHGDVYVFDTGMHSA